MAQVFFTDDGRADFREAKASAMRKWGPVIRDAENNAIKSIVTALKVKPLRGTVPATLAAIGMHDYRQSLTTYNRVFHYYEQASDSVYIVMIIPQMRDFPAHLAKRMLNPPALRGMQP
jgi:plasmid stabilization system protein ParE